ncbi:MAG: hypothetical protein ACI8QZ_002168 [Chlamydiales bacterium]|jgi:hypothetical protein
MRAPESRLHLFVLSACVVGCVAVSMWPKDDPLPTPASVGAEVKAVLERTLGLESVDPPPVLAPAGTVPSRRDHREPRSNPRE